MPRLISFAMTTAQVKRREKTVTRRWGWDHAKPGMILDGVEKAMGLKKGESVNRLARIIVISANKERLDRMITEPLYGIREMKLEGYPFGLTDPVKFVEKLAKSANKKPSDLITRIEFDYIGYPDCKCTFAQHMVGDGCYICGGWASKGGIIT